MNILGKAGAELLVAFAKSFGGEAGKKVLSGNKQAETGKKESKVDSAQKTIHLFTEKYDMEDLQRNLCFAGKCAQKLIPIAAATYAAYIVVPVVAGATAFATLGAGASAMTYSVANGVTVMAGAYKGGKEICNLFRPEKERDEDEQEEAGTEVEN